MMLKYSWQRLRNSRRARKGFALLKKQVTYQEIKKLRMILSIHFRPFRKFCGHKGISNGARLSVRCQPHTIDGLSGPTAMEEQIWFLKVNKPFVFHHPR